MKVTVTNSSSPLVDLLTPAQKRQIKKVTLAGGQVVWVFEVMTTSEKVYFENGAAATTTTSTELEEGEGTYTIVTEGLGNINVIGSAASVDLRVMPM